MNYRPYCLASGTLFALVAVLHFARIVLDLPLVIGDYTVPLAFTVLGVILPAGLAIWAFRIAGRRHD